MMARCLLLSGFLPASMLARCERLMPVSVASLSWVNP
jgi:hypothetical protein